MEADITSQAVGLASNTDFSLWSLFLRADFIVKSVGAVMGRLHVMTKYKPAQISSDLRSTIGKDRSSRSTIP